MLRQSKIVPTFRMRGTHLPLVTIHDRNCDCAACDPGNPDDLTASDLGKLGCLAVAVTSAMMFVIDPAGASAALLATMGR